MWRQTGSLHFIQWCVFFGIYFSVDLIVTAVTKTPNHRHVSVSIIAVAAGGVLLILALAWCVYARQFPTSGSGQILIRVSSWDILFKYHVIWSLLNKGGATLLQISEFQHYISQFWDDIIELYISVHFLCPANT